MLGREKDDEMSRRAAVSSATAAIDVEGGGLEVPDDDKRPKSSFSGITTFQHEELPKTTFAGVILGALIATMLVRADGWIVGRGGGRGGGSNHPPPPLYIKLIHTHAPTHSLALPPLPPLSQTDAEVQPIVLVLGLCAYGLVYSFWLSGYVLSKDVGTPAMRAVSDPIREGAEGFLKVQYSAVFRMAALLSVLIFLSYYLRPTPDEEEAAANKESSQGVSLLSNGYLGMLCAASFVTGASCSAIAGYLAMWVAARTNIRVASAARRSYSEGLVICFRGGAFSAVLDLTLCVVGVTLLFVVLWSLHATDIGVALGLVGENQSERLHVTDIPILMVGYGFGASFVALFMQLGGGIYTKAADVGADLVGKVRTRTEGGGKAPIVKLSRRSLQKEREAMPRRIFLPPNNFFVSSTFH